MVRALEFAVIVLVSPNALFFRSITVLPDAIWHGICCIASCEELNTQWGFAFAFGLLASLLPFCKSGAAE